MNIFWWELEHAYFGYRLHCLHSPITCSHASLTQESIPSQFTVTRFLFQEKELLLWDIFAPPANTSFTNRPFPSSLLPLFQNESKCETFHMKMSSASNFIFMQISHFHKNGFALRLALKQRHKGTRKWLIRISFCHLGHFLLFINIKIYVWQCY